MPRILLASAFAATLALAGSALAQSSSTSATSNNMAANTPNQQTTGQSSVISASQLKQELQQAGFSDVKILEDAFVVQAKTKDGNPIVMTIGPHGMSAMEMMSGSSAQNRTGTTGSQPSPAAPSTESKSSGQVEKQK